MIFKDSHFSIFLGFDTNIHLFFTKKLPIWAPEKPKWGHIGIPGAFLRVSWVRFLLLWALRGALGHSLVAVQEPLGTVFLHLGTPRTLPEGFFFSFRRFSPISMLFRVFVTLMDPR